jgi:hypothetical protein
MKSAKSQEPNNKEVPGSQGLEKQPAAVSISRLEFAISLAFGAWNLEL